jgi:hypothetical protein
MIDVSTFLTCILAHVGERWRTVGSGRGVLRWLRSNVGPQARGAIEIPKHGSREVQSREFMVTTKFRRLANVRSVDPYAHQCSVHGYTKILYFDGIGN